VFFLASLKRIIPSFQECSMKRKNEASPEQLRLPFKVLLDGANRLCAQFAIGLRRRRASELPDHYKKAYAASLQYIGRKFPEKQDSGTGRVTDVLQK
jgi:hypothetical protein